MKESQELKKHINVIHSHSKFTLVQRKLVNALLFNAYNKLPHQTAFSIKTKELTGLIGYSSRDIAGLKRSLKGLLSIIIEWNVLDASIKDSDKWTATTLLASAEIYKGLCTYSYSEMLRTLLHRPEIYGNIDMDLMRLFRSNYGLTLYENCIRFSKIKQTSWFSLIEFRKIMGIDESKYKSFNDFKKRVINVAVNEVNEISPIKITPDINKQDKSIRFLLTKKIFNQEDRKQNNDDDVFIDILHDTFGLSHAAAKNVIEKHGIQYIKEKIDIITKSPAFKSGNINHLAGYLHDAISKDYQVPISSNTAVKKIEKAKDDKLKSINKEKDFIKEKYKKYVNNEHNKLFHVLGEKEILRLKGIYVEGTINSSIIKKYFKAKGFEHPMIKGGFIDFLRKTLPDKFCNILSEDEFKSVFSD